MRWILVVLAAMLTLPQMARAERLAQTPVFAIAPIADASLADERGGQAPFARLTRGGALRLADDQARADLRQTGGVARIQMDVWWGSTGSELIAQSVRAAQR